MGREGILGYGKERYQGFILKVTKPLDEKDSVLKNLATYFVNRRFKVIF